MAGMWGVPDKEEMRKLQRLVKEWARRDLEGALGWARGLTNEHQRQMAIVAVAASLSASDEVQGFEILCELEYVQDVFLEQSGINNLIPKRFKTAAFEGAAELLAVLGRVPKSDGRGSWQIAYPENFDFEVLLDGLRKMREESALRAAEGDFSFSVYSVNDPLATYADRDYESAFAYVIKRGEEGEAVDWGGILDRINRSLGRHKANQLLAESNSSLSQEQMNALTVDDGFVRRNDSRELVRMLDAESATMMRRSMMQNIRSSYDTDTLAFLDDLAAPEERVAEILALRGVEEARPFENALKRWGYTAEQVSEVLEVIQGSAE